MKSIRHNKKSERLVYVWSSHLTSTVTIERELQRHN